MKSFLALLFVSSIAQASITTGLYVGQAEDGSVCELNVGKQTFENNQAHPLNERFVMIAQGKAFTVRHPALISETEKTAGFDHDQFHGVLPNNLGADALVVKKIETTTFEGPSEYYLINHQYKKDLRSLFVCKNLQLKK